MRKTVLFLSVLLSLLLGVNVFAAQETVAYEARGIMYVPIIETFEGLGFDVDPRISNGGVIEVSDGEVAYTIYLHAHLIVKRSEMTKTLEPDRYPELIRESYYLPFDMFEQYFDIAAVQNAADKTLSFTYKGKSFSLKYISTTYEEIEKSVKTNSYPQAVEKTAPVPQSGYLVDGVTFAPIRYTFESLGYEVEYNEETSVIYLRNSEYDYTVYLGAKQVARTKPGVGNKVFTPDYAPLNINGSYYLPLRNMADILEADISWDQTTRTAHISRGGKDCYVNCEVFVEPKSEPAASTSGSTSHVRHGYIFMPDGSVIIVQITYR
ncbi:MAG: hypothetical protein IJL89_01030 [Firmicutes bacterium]|nr:hypothetical protein [Bacillota bacterium]